MFVVTSLGVAVALCIVTMLGWGSWANTQKLAGKQNWPFSLYYWDYAIGVCFFGILVMLTLGSFGAAGMPATENLASADSGRVWRALLSGVLFNVSNILLVVAIDSAGMSVAFPVGVGIALVLGTVISYIEAPKGNSALLFGGVAFVVAVMTVSALVHRANRPLGNGGARHGLLFAILAGLLMGSFYPQLASAISAEFSTSPIKPGYLTPYAALALFGMGMLASNFIVNTIFIRSAGLKYADYFKATWRLHALGFLGGLIWMVALSCNVIASGVAGPAISYALGQGATLVAALWGVFVWKEFAGATARTGGLVAMMLASYAVGLTLIGLATVVKQ